MINVNNNNNNLTITNSEFSSSLALKNGGNLFIIN